LSSSPGFINIPLGLVEGAEQRDLFQLHVLCKDARTYRVQFAASGQAEEWTRRLLDEISPPVKLEDIFAFAHFAWAAEGGHEELAEATQGGREEPADCTWFRSELARLRFDLQGAWRVSLANTDHKLCPTYPQEILLPASISDSVLEKVAQFRSQRRIPAVVWRNTANGAVLARCSQPEVGWLGWRSAEDEELVRAVAEACAYDGGTLNRRHASGSESGSCGGLGEIPSLKDLSAEAAASLGDVKKVPS
jgi:myotubularin-related protein 3/4